MDIRSGIEFIRRLEKELVLFNLDESEALADQLKAHFDTQNVRISTERTSSGRPQVAVLSDRDGVLTLTDGQLLRQLTSHDPTNAETIGIADAEYEDILRHLKETTFTSYDTSDMLYASREIEDRARRVGEGTLHAGFQRLEILREEQSVYTDLADQGLDVHTYGVPDTEPPDIGSGQVHSVETTEIATTWFVVFDGGGEETQKSALIAEEQGKDDFYGAWTYDPVIVDQLCGHLERTYVTDSRTEREFRG